MKQNSTVPSAGIYRHMGVILHIDSIISESAARARIEDTGTIRRRGIDGRISLKGHSGLVIKDNRPGPAIIYSVIYSVAEITSGINTGVQGIKGNVAPVIEVQPPEIIQMSIPPSSTIKTGFSG
ncbi:hypothetical protein ACE3VH_004735, partial [Salmonella enterica]